MTVKHWLVSIAALAALQLPAGRASAQAAKPDQKTSPPKTCPPYARSADQRTEPTSREEWQRLDYRALSQVIGVAECWSADLDNDSQRYLNGYYSSLLVERVDPASFDPPDPSKPQPDMIRDYKSERRNFFKRLFVGKVASLLVTAQVRVRDPDVNFTIPLMSVDYNGKSGQGESFVTNLTRSDMGEPFFRMTPNTTMSVTVDARTSTSTDVNAGGAIVSTLKDALALAAPGSTLVTTVNSARLNQIAGTFDAGLSKLWSNSVSETTTSSRPMSEWYPHAGIYVSVDVPDNVRTYDDRERVDGYGSNVARRTIWFRIRASCPRLSIFDTANICEFDNDFGASLVKKKQESAARDAIAHYVAELQHRVDPHQVLNYNLSTGKTIRQYITEQPWFAALTKDITGTITPAAGGKTAQFCETVVEQLYGAGLSNLDAQISLWALAGGLPDLVGAQARFDSDPVCKAHLPGDWKVKGS